MLGVYQKHLCHTPGTALFEVLYFESILAVYIALQETAPPVTFPSLVHVKQTFIRISDPPP